MTDTLLRELPSTPVATNAPSVEALNKPRKPVENAEDTGRNSMRYLGIEVQKAEVFGSSVPKIDAFKFKKIVDTKEALEVKQAIALAMIMGEPLHLQGGTGHGKSRIPKQMAAQLGYNVIEYGADGYKLPDDILGEPGHDGPLTAGLRVKPGEKNMIIINEANSIQPDALVAIYGALDALAHNEPYVIKGRDGKPDEVIHTRKEDTIIIFTSNAVTDEYTGITPFSKALVRRVSTHKVPEDLTPDDFSYFMHARFNKAGPVPEGITEESYLDTNSIPLDEEELYEIPGFPDALELYIKFHNQIISELQSTILDNKTNGEPVAFPGYVMGDKIIQFMKRFCPNDQSKVLPTLQKALKFYYANRFDDHNRERVEGLIDNLGTTEAAQAPESFTDHLNNDLQNQIK